MENAPPALVERAKQLILTPRAEWPVIAAEPTTVADIYRRYVVILAAVPAVAGLIGNMVFGYSVFGLTMRMSPVTAISLAVTQYITSLISVFVLALIIDALAPNFGGTRNRIQAIKVAAYSWTAAWVAGVLAIIPQLAPLGELLGLYSLYLLYLGLPLLMRAPPDKAIGYTIVTILAALVLSVVVGAITARVGGMLTPAAPIVVDATGAATLSVPPRATLDLSQLGAAARQAERSAADMKITDNGTVVPAVSPSVLQAMLPAMLGGYRRTAIESAGADVGGLGGTHAEARYEKGDSSIRLGLTDMAAAGALAALGGGIAVQANRETADGYENTRTIGGRVVSEKWDRLSREGSYSELVANRFMVSAEGRVGDISELKRAAATIPADRLEALTN